MWRTLLRGLGYWLLAIGVVACGSTEVKPADGGVHLFELHARVPDELTAALARAPECCTLLANLPYQDLAHEGQLTVNIGVDAPAFTFENGKSFFAAYRIAGMSRPARIELSSFRSAGPGSLAQVIPEAQQLVFEPTLLVLDEQFQVRQRVNAGAPLKGCETQWAAPVFTLPLTLAEQPSEAAYLVVMTTRDSLQRVGREVCGVRRHGMSPIGRLKAQVETLQFTDPPLQALLPGRWHADAQEVDDIGLLSHMTAEPALLVLGGTSLQVLEGRKGRYTPRVTIPYSAIVRVASGQWGPRERYLFVSTLGLPGEAHATARHFIFDAVDPLAPAGPSLEQAMALLAANITPDRVTETVAWRVLPGEPVLEVGGPGTPERIGQAAFTGGAFAALPCGLCQIGACTPEVLASCAALFTMGAVIGGLTAGLQESLARSPGLPDATRQQLWASIDLQRRAGVGKDRMAQCLSAELVRPPKVVWRDQGRTAFPVMRDFATLAPGTPAQTGAAGSASREVDYTAEATVTRISLLPESGAPKGDAETRRLRLGLDVEIHLTDRHSGKRRSTTVSWSSPPHSPVEWTAADSALVSNTAAQGCQELARLIVNAGEKAWARR